MPSIWKSFSRPKAERYQFPDAEDLRFDEPSPEPVTEPAEVQPETVPPAPPPPPEPEPEPDPIEFAQIQAEQILEDARRRAEEILENAEREAQAKAEELYESSRQAGLEAGRAEGILQGTAQAMEENRQVQARQMELEAAEIQQFLDKAGAALDRQMDENVEELRDLALAIAEKVISVSLKSSSEVICRMIQTAVDKRKRREWAHIYIAECDAKHLVKLPASLTAALASLSDRVRIIPMADDESGTCIIEMPDEIIDASAATQMENIRGLLADAPAPGFDGNLNFGRGPGGSPLGTES